MGMTERYVRMHEDGGQYKKSPDGNRHQSAKGWYDTEVGGDMIFSHRQNDYTAENFTEGLHSHDYYELLLYLHGKVEYVCDNTLVSPAAPTAVWFSPGQMHTARLRAPSRYERYVLYFSKDFFKTEDGVTPILDFMESGAHAIPLPEAKQAELLRILKRADELSASHLPHAPLLMKAYLLELFDLLSDPLMKAQAGRDFEDPMAAVKQYIDESYAEISSVTQVAEHFFYSREHLSRAFARSFNISVAAYITRRRVAEGLKLLSHMRAADASYTVGFRSQSAFIAAFKKYTGYLPSEHAAKIKRV